MKVVKPKSPRRLPSGADVRRRVRAYFDERRLLKYIIYCGLGGFFLGYLLITLLFFPGFGRSAIVTVPDVRGMPQNSARRALERAGLEMARGTTLNNPRVPAGRVLSQVPLPGQEASRGSDVRIILSAGPDKRPVPSIAGMDRDEAISLLQRMGFQVRLRHVTNTAEEGTLLGIDPKAGTQVAMPGVVVLNISAGPPKIVTPSVLNVTQEQAAATLEAAGLRLGRISYDSTSAAPLGDIVAQSPAAGDSIRMGGAVRITLSGRDPRPPPPPDSAAAAIPTDSAAAAEGEPEEGEPDPEPAPPAPPPATPSPSPGERRG
ncbi:MAG TPA: PASTA domain-containing protein [Longimicrobium sp.]|nr:PASTA domain-containing protein [Longimicrobium sp.]